MLVLSLVLTKKYFLQLYYFAILYAVEPLSLNHDIKVVLLFTVIKQRN